MAQNGNELNNGKGNRPARSDAKAAACKEAHRLLDLGYTPIPAESNKKRPACNWKAYQTTPPTHDEIDDLFAKFPKATGLGIITTGLAIIDVDMMKDGSKNPFLDSPICRDAMASTTVVISPSGGHHLYFLAPQNLKLKNSVGKIADRVDVRTSGGFLVVPPTVRDGISYEYVNSQRLDVRPQELTVLPDEILKLMIAQAAPTRVSAINMEGPIPEGARDDTLFRLASKWRGDGHSREEILALLRLTNEARCDPPLGDPQLQKIAKSASKYEPNEPIEPAEPSIEHRDPGPIPDRLLTIPGFVSQVMDLILSTAPRPNRPLAFAGALTLLATLAGRKVRTESDLRTNIYTVALGESGIGKDQPRKIIKQIMFEVGLGDSVLGSMASGQALEDEIVKTHSCLALTDEMDEFLMAIRKDKSGTRQNLAKVMMELFTSASGPYQTRAKANQDRKHIYQPNFCLFGTAVPVRFYESISARMMDDGFLGRSIVIEAGSLGPRQPSKVIEIPEDILAIARDWVFFYSHHELDQDNPAPLIVRPSEVAEKILEQAADDFDEMRNKASRIGDNSSVSVWARAWEHTSKLALIYAISENHRDPVITSEAAKWAVEFVGHHTRRLIATMHDRVAENEFHALLLKVKTKLGNSPNKTMTRSRLIKNMHITARDLDQVIGVLLESHEIEAIQSGAGTPNRSGTIYRLVNQ
ncbi:MAG: hypothetical protein ACI9UU_003022 [Candidatus Azotimanducaceae bacterium]|jgi:hypothetical protein